MPGRTSRRWPATSSSAGSRMPSRTGPESAAFGGPRRSWRKASADPAAGRGASTANPPAGSVPHRTTIRRATMTTSDLPHYATGKICYIEIPATDIGRSAEFYSQAFGWQIRERGDGHTAFDDTVGEVSGTWVLDRPP